jgi:hypothetical protein
MTHTMNGAENKHVVSNTGISRLSGVLMLLFLIVTVASGAVAVPLVHGEVVNTLNAINENPAGHQASLVLDWVSYITLIALAGTLYLLFRSHNQTLALLGTLFLVAASAILIVHDMTNMALTPIARDFVTTSGAEAVALQTVGVSMIITAKWGVSIGFTCFALGTLMYSVLIVSSEGLPRALGWLGIVASVLTFGTWLAQIDEGLNLVGMALFIPMMLWLLGLGIWLLVRGTREAEKLADVSN